MVTNINAQHPASPSQNFFLQLSLQKCNPTWKLCIHFVYKNCTRFMQLIYRKCTQNVYKMYTTFQQAFVYILYTKSKELCQLNFLYKMYTEVCRNVGYILYTNITAAMAGNDLPFQQKNITTKQKNIHNSAKTYDILIE